MDDVCDYIGQAEQNLQDADFKSGESTTADLVVAANTRALVFAVLAVVSILDDIKRELCEL